jgi:hypothetical protein
MMSNKEHYLKDTGDKYYQQRQPVKWITPRCLSGIRNTGKSIPGGTHKYQEQVKLR